MKKLLSVIVVLSASMLLITGCNTKENTTDSTPAATATSKATATQEAIQTTTETETSEFIGEAKAQDIALEKAGITGEDVIYAKSKLENDDGVWLYEVEFRKDRTEYDAEIKADDGTILSWDEDVDD